MDIHPRIGEVTERVRLKSRDSGAAYRERLARARDAGPGRELFGAFRAIAGRSETGAGIISFGGRA